MPIYRAKGTLVDAIPSEGVVKAQLYLTEDDMTQYLDAEHEGVVEHIEWRLESDGYNWSVTAFANRELTEAELKSLSSWVSGQNSDGLGEGFEQQAFAWAPDDGCDCDRGGYWCNCDGENGHMCSFDWETNDCAFERVK